MQDDPLIELKEWKKQGFEKIVLFGRFQPLHKGHMQLLETMRASGLEVHLVLNDKTDDIPGERNPFNPQQKIEMVRLALPWLPESQLHTANVYLGRTGVDVGEDVQKLSDIFHKIAPPDKLVFCYYEKEEDRKTYLVNGKTVEDVHYVELVGQPRGQFPVQKITEEMICAANKADHIPIDAKMFREAVKNAGSAQIADDGIVWDMLVPAVAHYVLDQYELADRNGRLVGADQSGDTFTLKMLHAEHAKQNRETQRRTESDHKPT